ncbi:MAG: glucans biosynthesis glucosyltransferase MdoH [Gammaproteobacteria bacterium]
MHRSIVSRNWASTASMRRRLLAALVMIPAGTAAGIMGHLLPQHGGSGLEIALVAVFFVLFAWVSFGFWTGIAGFLVLWSGRDRLAVSGTVPASAGAPDFDTRTAVLMPVCKEDPARVCAGLEAVFRSLKRSASLAQFDFFILSDTADPDTWVKEELAWAALCESVQGFGKIYYRRRRNRIKRKSGNVADFCRRWGNNYRYMVVLDADSVMAGETLVRLVQMMERNPDAGIIQTVPMSVNRHTLFARVQQFAHWAYASAFAAGLSFWQLGDGHYWGHNVIIRTAPFMRHCMLPRLPGDGPLSGDIMSHDFVEASLMRRAGWKVWLAYDLPGSFEEAPPTLPDELKRDRRWCHGNLQHLRVMFADGLQPFHRLLFLNGVLSYVSAPLWALFLVLGMAEVIVNRDQVPAYFTAQPSLFPHWPTYHPGWTAALLAATAVLLFLPKILSVLLLQARLYGGRARLWTSVVLENLISLLLAPTRMVFHSQFVCMTLLGRRAGWAGQTRNDHGIGWRQALRLHAFGIAIGAGATAVAASGAPGYIWWLSPVLVGLLAAAPLTVILSRESLGRAARRWGLFLTPCELEPPEELRDLDRRTAAYSARITHGGFVDALFNPVTNAVHIALQHSAGGAARLRPGRAQLRQRLLASGPDALTAAEKNSLLTDPAAMVTLHGDVWALPEAELEKMWPQTPRPVEAATAPCAV